MSDHDTLMLRLNAELDLNQQNSIIERVQNLPGVINAARLVPGVTDSRIANIVYLKLEEANSLNAVREALKRFDDVEDVSVPTRRSLKTPGF